MGITLFGRRDLRIWPRAEAVEQEEGVVDEPSLVAGLAPGSVYMGTLAAPEHQAVHANGQNSLLRARHSVTLIVRTTLFPYNQSRRMRQMASPAVTCSRLWWPRSWPRSPMNGGCPRCLNAKHMCERIMDSRLHARERASCQRTGFVPLTRACLLYP